jgi:PAS domain S-box-containing protein
VLQAATSAEICEHEGWLLRKDGKLFWANVTTIPVRAPDDTTKGILQLIKDYTERHLRQEQLRSSEERSRRLIEDVRDYAIFTLDPRGYVTSWNAGARFIKGYESHEIIGSHFSRFYPPDAIERNWPEHELQVASMDGRFEDEGWRLRKDGTRFWANVVITALRDADGNLLGFSKITRDLSERRRQEELQRRSEERFRLLVEAVRDYALFMLDPRGFVSSWNAGAERIHGWRSEEISGKHFSHFYRSEEITADRPWHELKQARESGRLLTEGWRVRKDGAKFLARVSLVPLFDAHQELYGYAHLTQDLTQERHAEALENVAERINEFLGILAHELRNPLAPIRNAVALMERKGLGDTTLESMRKTIERQSGQLERIINELLDVSRVARGELNIERKPVNLSETIQHAVEASRPIVELREHQLHVSLANEPVFVSGDQMRLSQAVVNLLNNAAKYTPARGEIWLELGIGDGFAIIKVRDTGVGIRPEMQYRIFDLFAQDRETLSLANGGLGVGLTLVRRVVEMHGGRVDVESEGRDRGSEFVIRLPLRAEGADESQAQGNGDKSLELSLPRRRILIADDNVDAAWALDALLQAMGQETYVVHDGLAALEAAQQSHFDLVLLDIGMPKLNGYEVATRLRTSEEGKKLVLVAVTGWGLDADKRRAHEVGFDFHFVKPASVVGLKRLILNPNRPSPPSRVKA